MTPEKVVIGNAELWHADCMDVLRSFPECFRVGLLLTDPPFGVSNFVQTTGRVTGRGKNIGRAVEWNESGPPAEWFDLVRRIARHRIIWGANFFNCFEPNGGAIIWLKQQKVPNFSKAEIASCTHFRKTEIVTIPWTNFKVAHEAVTDHPCERPVALYDWCLRYIPDSHGTVLDPYMGSGSVGVSCARAGRPYIGIERDRKYFDAACNRIAHAQAQGVLFHETEQPVQESFL
jgi:DNA modification methylase